MYITEGNANKVVVVVIKMAMYFFTPDLSVLYVCLSVLCFFSLVFSKFVCE